MERHNLFSSVIVSEIAIGPKVRGYNPEKAMDI
jgi:hypothetical protein